MGGLVRRDRCMDMLEAGRGLTDVVKVITGMRRSGRSTLLAMYREELVSSGVDTSEIVIVDLESLDYQDVRTGDSLNRVLVDLIGTSGRRYVFIEGIRNVDGWEESVSALVNTGRCDIYITGSGPGMLTSDLITHLSGRFVEVPVLPLSFQEYMGLHPGDPADGFASYLRFGALPGIDPGLGGALCDSLLTGIYSTILVEDVLKRMGPCDARTLCDVARFLFSHIGEGVSVDSVARGLGIGNDTAARYMDGLADASLILRSERFDIAAGKALRTNGRYYATDLGLRNAALMGPTDTDARGPLENVVYLELLRRGYAVRIGVRRGREVGLMATRDGVTEYYRVCPTMMPEEARGRELGALRSMRDDRRKTVLTMDRFGLGDEEGIRIANLIDWLLDDE